MLKIWCHNHKEITEAGKPVLVCLGHMAEARVLNCPHDSYKASQSCRYPCMDAAEIAPNKRGRT